MRRSIYIPITLGLLALSVVALVKAQEFSSWRQGETAGVSQQVSNSAASLSDRQPDAHLERANAGASLSRFSQSTFSEAPGAFAASDASPLPGVSPTNEAGLPSLPLPRDEMPAADDDGVGTASIQLAQATSNLPSVLKRRPEEDDLPAAPLPPVASTANTNVTLPPTQGSSRRPRAERETVQAPAAVAPPQETVAPPARTSVPLVASRQQPKLSRVESGASANMLLEAKGPAISINTAGPRTITIGKASTYIVEIANASEAGADEVTVTVDVPRWAEIASTSASSGTARYEATQGETARILWTLFRLEGNDRQQLTLNVIPRESRPFDLALGWTYVPKSRIAQIEVQEPKLQMTLAGPRDVLYGETKIYTITVSNPGSGPAENVMVNLLPITPGQEDAAASKIGTIEPGGRKVIEIELTARQAGDLEIRAQAFADGGLRTEAAEQIRVRRAALEVAVAGAEAKYAGTLTAYQVRVGNVGDAPADSVKAVATLPRGAQFVSCTEGGLYNKEQGNITWQLGAMRPGAVRTCEIRCVLIEAGANRLAMAAQAESDLQGVGEFTTNVEALADLKLTVNDPQGPTPTGEPALFEIKISNRGTKAADRIRLVAFFSEGIEPISVEGANAELGVGQVAFREIERLAAGQEMTVKITARADRPGSHTFRAEVACDSPQTTLAAQETTQFYGDTVASQPPAASSAPRAALGEPEPADPSEAGLPPRFNSFR